MDNVIRVSNPLPKVTEVDHFNSIHLSLQESLKYQVRKLRTGDRGVHFTGSRLPIYWRGNVMVPDVSDVLYKRPVCFVGDNKYWTTEFETSFLFSNSSPCVSILYTATFMYWQDDGVNLCDYVGQVSGMLLIFSDPGLRNSQLTVIKKAFRQAIILNCMEGNIFFIFIPECINSIIVQYYEIALIMFQLDSWKAYFVYIYAYMLYIIECALELNPLVRVQTFELGNSIMQLGSVDEPLCHIGDSVTGPNHIPPYLVQLVSNKLSLSSISDTSECLKSVNYWTGNVLGIIIQFRSYERGW
jgi:hypothetical protein